MAGQAGGGSAVSDGGAAGRGWAAWLCTPLWRRRWLWEMQLRPLLGTTLHAHAPVSRTVLCAMNQTESQMVQKLAE